MVQMTPEASELLDAARRAEGVPDSFGVRVYAAPIAEGPAAELRISFAEDPWEGDTVTDQQGTRLFVARELAEFLSDAFIDREGTDLVVQPAHAV